MSIPAARFVVSCAQSINESDVHGVVSQYESTLDIKTVRGAVDQVFKQSQLLVAASGTVTLEAALHGVPTIIIYKVSPLSYWLGKRLIKVKHIGIVNLIVQKELQPELIQDEASPQAIARTATAMINNPERLKQMKKELVNIRDLLGGTGASDRVARIAMNLI